MIEDFSHYCFDGGPAVLLESLMWLFFAATLIMRGVWGDTSGPFAKRRERNEREQLTKELCSWHIVTDEREADAVLPSVHATWRRLHAPALVGGGIGVLVAFGLCALASGALTGSLLLLSAFASIPAYAAGFLFGSIGYVVGLGYGAHRLRRAHQGAPRYADARPRLLRSYRPVRVPLLLGALVLLNVVATIIEAPYIAPQLHISVAGGAQYLVPTSPNVVAAPLLFMVLTVGLMELLAAQVVSLPRLASGLAPARAIQVDDMLRLKAVITVEAAAVVIIATLTSTQEILIAYGLGYVHSAAAGIAGLLAAPYVSSVLGIFGVLRLTGGQTAAGLTDWLFAPRNARWRTPSSL